MTHPSYLELDRHALGEPSETLRRHVEACPRCRAHVEKLRQPGALPAWLAEVDRSERTLDEHARRRATMRWLGGLSLAAAAAAAFVAWLPPEDPPGYVAAKGMPSVAIYLLRDGRSQLWDGTTPVRPGDRIRMKVAPAGHDWLAVSALAPDGTSIRLYEARIDAATDHLLPESWRIDDAPGPERLHVALDRRAVDPARAAWTTTIELPKEVP